MNNNNQGGNNNSTAFSAYNAQKNSAKSAANKAVLNKGMNVASKAIPALKAAKPMVNMAAENAAMRKKAAEETSDSENESVDETQNDTQSPFASMANAGIETAKDTAKTAAKQAVKKFVIAHWPIFAGIIGVLIALLLIVVFATYALENINNITDLAIGGYESGLNVVTGNGFQTNHEAALSEIDKAARSYSGLDKGILIATLNDAAFVSPTLYEEDLSLTENVDGGSEGMFDAAKNFIANKYSIHSFYNMKRDMIGKGTGDAGSALNSIIGLEISVECVPQSKYNKATDAKALLAYAYQGLLAADDVLVTEISDNMENGFRTIWFGSIELNYKDQGSDFIWKETSEAVNFIDNLPSKAIKNDWQELKKKAAQCSLQYETDANGNPIVTKPLVAQYTSAEKQNDYAKYYNYIKKVYVPVVYMSVWKDMNDEAKKALVNDVWGDIVRSRNDYYAIRGEGNELTYEFEDSGKLVAYVTYSAGSSSSYYSSLTLNAARSEASTWKQWDSRWADFYIGSRDIPRDANCSVRTMRCIGCLATSISILIANSGTQINSPTFDPGVFAETNLRNGGFDERGNLSHKYGSLTPYFHWVSWVNTSGMAKATIADKIISYLLDGYQVIINVNSGGHFVAVIGVEDGRILIGDPGWGVTPYYFDDNSKYPEGTIAGLSIYVADDVRGN